MRFRSRWIATLGLIALLAATSQAGEGVSFYGRYTAGLDARDATGRTRFDRIFEDGRVVYDMGVTVFSRSENVGLRLGITDEPLIKQIRGFITVDNADTVSLGFPTEDNYFEAQDDVNLLWGDYFVANPAKKKKPRLLFDSIVFLLVDFKTKVKLKKNFTRMKSRDQIKGMVRLVGGPDDGKEVKFKLKTKFNGKDQPPGP